MGSMPLLEETPESSYPLFLAIYEHAARWQLPTSQGKGHQDEESLADP